MVPAEAESANLKGIQTQNYIDMYSEEYILYKERIAFMYLVVLIHFFIAYF